MKKVLSLILVFVVFLSLCACGTNTAVQNAVSDKKTVEVVGKWTAADGNSRVYIYLNEDYTGEMEAGGISLKYTWEYDESTRVVTINFEAVNLPGKLTYQPEDDTLAFPDRNIILNRAS